MLKTTSTASPAASIEERDQNPEKSGQRVQVEDQGEKKLAQKSCKSQKSQKTAKSKKWVSAKKTKASRARNLNNQSGDFLNTDARKTFTKLRQAFIEAVIRNHFDP